MSARVYRANDSVGVKKLILSILAKEYPFDQSAYKDTDINDISGTYSGEDNIFFVVEKNKKIVGAVGVKKEAGNRALLRRLFVDESYRGKGFGTELLKSAVGFCKSKHYKTFVFRATDRMSKAMKLCKKEGFKETEDLEVSGFHIHKLTLDI